MSPGRWSCRGIKRRERRERAGAALELVGLREWGNSMPQQLSGGMKQRVGLARGLALDTPVLLMDEPFSALDPVIRRDLQDELIQLQESVHKTIVFITHDLNEAVRVGDQIAIMRDGAVVQQGAPTEVVLEPANDFVREFTQDVRLHAMVTAGSVMDTPSSLPGSMLVSEATAHLEAREQNSVKVIDEQSRYLGTAHLPRLLAAARERDRPLAALNALHRRCGRAGHGAGRSGAARFAFGASLAGSRTGRRVGRTNSPAAVVAADGVGCGAGGCGR